MEIDNTLTLVEVKKTVSANLDRVFKALTEPEQMNQWIYGMDEGSSQV